MPSEVYKKREREQKEKKRVERLVEFQSRMAPVKKPRPFGYQPNRPSGLGVRPFPVIDFEPTSLLGREQESFKKTAKPPEMHNKTLSGSSLTHLGTRPGTGAIAEPRSIAGLEKSSSRISSPVFQEKRLRSRAKQSIARLGPNVLGTIGSIL